MMDAADCFWKGRPLTELTRDELLQVCLHCFTEMRNNRQEMQRRLNAMDVKQYLMNGGSNARV